jgi:hypothetical protein
VKHLSTREIADLTYKIEILLASLYFIADDSWHDLIDWSQLDKLAGFRNQIIHNHSHTTKKIGNDVFREMEKIYEDLFLELRHLKLIAPEAFDEKMWWLSLNLLMLKLMLLALK